LTRVTSDARSARPVWTPDGTRVTYGSSIGGNENLFWKPVDGSGSAERLVTSDNLQVAASWSPDGQTLAFVELSPQSGFDIWVLSLAGDRRPRAIIQTRFNEA
jgi:Tol biopolymer transport system component